MSKEPAEIPTPQRDRIAKVRAEMARRKIDGYLVQDRMDQYWLTGFTGEDGAVLLTPRSVALLTDSRFDEAADREAPYARKVLRKKRDAAETVRELRRGKVTRLAFNPDHMNVSEYAALRKAAAPSRRAGRKAAPGRRARRDSAAPIRLIAASDLIRPVRTVKDAGEVQVIRRAIRIAEEAFQEVRRSLRPGLTEREIAAQLAYEMQKRGAQGESFPAIVAAGANASLPHYEPGDRKLAENEVLLIDWGARVEWYASDLTRVVWLGSIPPQMRAVFDIVRTAHDRAIEVVRPGIRAKAVDRVAREVIKQAGYGKQFGHGLGHGIGCAVHELPRLSRISKDVLAPGMVLTIEPGIYIPGVGGVRIEDDVLVTETGHEVLSSLPAEFS